MAFEGEHKDVADLKGRLRRETAARRFEELFQNLPIACLGFDASGTIHEWNRAAESLLRQLPGELLGKTLLQVLCSRRTKEELRLLIEQVYAGDHIEGRAWKIEGKNTDDIHLILNAFPNVDLSGSICGAILSCVDVTALEEANVKLLALASTDGLTGIANHRSFQEICAREIKRCARTKTPLSLVIMDVDHFKKYNDSFGHPAGDEVLRDVAKILTLCSRGSDVAARYGGEEFVVLLPDTDVEGAKICAERMRKAIECGTWTHREITVSIGASTLGAGIITQAELVATADKALYCSKLGGRNRVSHYLEAINF